MKLSEQIAESLNNLSDNKSYDDNTRLNLQLRLLCKWRSQLIQNTLLKKSGTVVLDGPFKDLKFIDKSAEGCHVAKLLGCYEQPLHKYLIDAMESSYTTILNIGCAEGYYAVGFARCMSTTIVWAFDTDIAAQMSCKRLAEMNNVSHRIQVGGEFCLEDFSKYKDQQTLLICDIEGAEESLLDPDKAPALRDMDIIVESHECLRPGITETLISRFGKSHHIVTISDNGSRIVRNAPNWFANLAHLDQLLATWEWRSGPTPWLVMQAKHDAG